jgi:hypothetical protein
MLIGTGRLSKEERQRQREKKRQQRRERKAKRRAEAGSQLDLFGSTAGDNDEDNDNGGHGGLDSAEEPPSSDDERESTRHTHLLERSEWSRSISVEESQQTLMAFEADSKTQKLRAFIRKGSVTSGMGSNSSHATTPATNKTGGAPVAAAALVAPASNTTAVSPIKREPEIHFYFNFWDQLIGCFCWLQFGRWVDWAATGRF